MRNLSMSEAIRETLASILRRDDKAFLIGEDIAVYGGAFKIGSTDSSAADDSDFYWFHTNSGGS